MCGLFGFVYYDIGEFDGKELAEELGMSSVIRGHHATGIAYNFNNRLRIKKEAKAAYSFNFDFPKGVNVLMGHTRYTTQGSEKYNQNNHPFKGKAGGQRFALAHNGVLNNVWELQDKYNLPTTNIMTDSYVAIQLIEHYGEFSIDSIRWAAERITGMFTLTLLDKQNNLYIVKNDSPLAILHFRSRNLYVYASTKEILFKALINTILGNDIYAAFEDGFTDVELLEPLPGEIWKICNNGIIEKHTFIPREEHYKYYSYGTSYVYDDFEDEYDDYLEMLYRIAENKGYKRTDLNVALSWGYSLTEIEQAIFDNTFRQIIDEINAVYDGIERDSSVLVNYKEA